MPTNNKSIVPDTGDGSDVLVTEAMSKADQMPQAAPGGKMEQTFSPRWREQLEVISSQSSPKLKKGLARMKREMKSPEFVNDKDKKKCLEFLTEFTEDVLSRNERQEKYAARMTQTLGRGPL
jgi:hypothetical protein